MTSARGPALALLVATGCAVRASAPANMTPSASSGASYAPAASSVSTRETGTGSTGMAGGSAPTSQIASVPGTAPARGPDGVVDEEAERDARIVQWEGEIQRQRAALAASLAQCRDICAAAGNVCTAAFEICRLTGDLSNTNARDGRCARARTACLDAGRRRDGACPTCPSR